MYWLVLAHQCKSGQGKKAWYALNISISQIDEAQILANLGMPSHPNLADLKPTSNPQDHIR